MGLRQKDLTWFPREVGPGRAFYRPRMDDYPQSPSTLKVRNFMRPPDLLDRVIA